MKPHSRDGMHALLTEQIIGAAIEVHRSIGPGLLESTYEECLDRELRESGLVVSRQLVVPLTYKGKPLASTYRLDLIVEERVIVEVKAVEKLARVHVPLRMSVFLCFCGRRKETSAIPTRSDKDTTLGCAFSPA